MGHLTNLLLSACAALVAHELVRRHKRLGHRTRTGLLPEEVRATAGAAAEQRHRQYQERQRRRAPSRHSEWTSQGNISGGVAQADDPTLSLQQATTLSSLAGECCNSQQENDQSSHSVLPTATSEGQQLRSAGAAAEQRQRQHEERQKRRAPRRRSDWTSPAAGSENDVVTASALAQQTTASPANMHSSIQHHVHQSSPSIPPISTSDQSRPLSAVALAQTLDRVLHRVSQRAASLPRQQQLARDKQHLSETSDEQGSGELRDISSDPNGSEPFVRADEHWH
ncbi:hypothetical protein ABBQ38_010720 [Trebouxia sp. C0009 RCD-2024]